MRAQEIIVKTPIPNQHRHCIATNTHTFCGRIMNVITPMTPANRFDTVESSAFPILFDMGLAMAAAIIIPTPMARVETDWAVAFP